ncbi:UbiA family prenyltransferase [bacterium]|nr:UbiA family prenyltransferase [bacterium]
MLAKLKIYWELMRPFTLLAPTVGFISGGLIAIGASSRVASTSVHLYPIILGAISAALLNAASNVVNQYFDIGIDRINKPNRPLPSGRISLKESRLLSILLYSFSFFLAYLVPNKQFITIVLITASITYAYSAPPLRTKRWVIPANLTIAIPRGCLLIVAGWTAVRSFYDFEPWFIGSIFALYLLGAASTKDFSDIKGDKMYGCNTLPIILGAKKAAITIAPFFVLPFLLIPYGKINGMLTGSTIVLYPLTAILVVWGGYTAYLILRKPEELTLEANHISWKHMYLMLLVGQIGFALAYLI